MQKSGKGLVKEEALQSPKNYRELHVTWDLSGSNRLSVYWNRISALLVA